MSTLLSKEAILSAEDLDSEVVEVPEWGGSVLVWELSGHERSRWTDSVIKRRGSNEYDPIFVDMDAKLVAAAVKDESGKRLFSDKEIGALSKKSAKALQRVVKVARRLSGLTDEAVAEIAKNSEASMSGVSGSA